MSDQIEMFAEPTEEDAAFERGLIWGAAVVAWAEAIAQEECRRHIVRELCGAGIHSYGHGEHCAYCGGRYEDLEVA